MAFRDLVFLLVIYSIVFVLQVSAGPLSASSVISDRYPSLIDDQDSSIVSIRHASTSTEQNATGQECDFDSIENFFEYAYENKLNITAEVQSCQSLCIMTYGKGNPDLSGIGMMHAYNLQVVLSVLFGPVYRLFSIVVCQYNRAPEGSSSHLFVSQLQNIQSLFYSSNGFFIISSAVASLVRLAQDATIFEIAEMQALAFLQLNSLLVSFLCLARPIRRWVLKTLATIVVFLCVVVVLAKSQLSSLKRTNWKEASLGCEHNASDFGVITPIPYPPAAVGIFAAAGFLGLCLRSLRAKFQGSKRNQILFKFLMVIWVMLIALMTACMVLGLAMVWRQREHLRQVVGTNFEDDIWGFGQVAALFIWAPVPVDMVYLLSNAAQQVFPLWNRTMSLEVADFMPLRNRSRSSTFSSTPPAIDMQPTKSVSTAATVVEV